MNKQEILLQILDKLQKQFVTMQEAAKSSHDAATGDEAKAEGKYDTRGLEASYLAGAQAEQCQKLSEAIHTLKNFPLTEDIPTTAQPGTLVEVESDGLLQYYFLLPCAGGVSLEQNGFAITTLTPDAPLYQAILGAGHGELIEEHDLLILDLL